MSLSGSTKIASVAAEFYNFMENAQIQQKSLTRLWSMKVSVINNLLFQIWNLTSSEFSALWCANAISNKKRRIFWKFVRRCGLLPKEVLSISSFIFFDNSLNILDWKSWFVHKRIGSTCKINYHFLLNKWTSLKQKTRPKAGKDLQNSQHN